jgi:hypothetical protein
VNIGVWSGRFPERKGMDIAIQETNQKKWPEVEKKVRMITSGNCYIYIP